MSASTSAARSSSNAAMQAAAFVRTMWPTIAAALGDGSAARSVADSRGWNRSRTRAASSGCVRRNSRPSRSSAIIPDFPVELQSSNRERSAITLILREHDRAALAELLGRHEHLAGARRDDHRGRREVEDASLDVADAHALPDAEELHHVVGSDDVRHRRARAEAERERGTAEPGSERDADDDDDEERLDAELFERDHRGDKQDRELRDPSEPRGADDARRCRRARDRVPREVRDEEAEHDDQHCRRDARQEPGYGRERGARDRQAEPLGGAGDREDEDRPEDEARDEHGRGAVGVAVHEERRERAGDAPAPRAQESRAEIAQQQAENESADDEDGRLDGEDDVDVHRAVTAESGARRRISARKARNSGTV